MPGCWPSKASSANDAKIRRGLDTMQAEIDQGAFTSRALEDIHMNVESGSRT